MQGADSLEKTLMMGKIEDWRRTRWQRMRCSDSITNTMDMNLSKLWVIMEDRGAWCATVHEVAKSQTWLSDWAITRTKITVFFFIKFEMLKKYPSRYIKIPVFLCLPSSFPRWHEVIRLPSSSPQITDYSDVFSESSVCSGLLSLRLSHFFFLTWPLSLLAVLPSLMNNRAYCLLSCFSHV